ncbi:MAG TPA: T9SS type A sorting domain-containing protein [Chitinophagales bacterium]|nr:T9SS type A sorting domain-containing protein [Chitinophagales bacterium]
MKHYYLFIKSLSVAILVSGLITAGKAQTVRFINANMVNAGTGIGGNLFSEADSISAYFNNATRLYNLYEAPKGSNKRAIYTAALWMSGLDTSGNLHCAAQTDEVYGGDYYNGPITANYNSAYDNYYKRVYYIDQNEITHYRALSFPANITDVDSDILLWPALGNTYVASHFGLSIDSPLAPFIDVNSNGVYEPLLGDYPALCGQQAVFFIFNDVRGPHYVTVCGQKLGFEITGMIYNYIDSSSTDFPFKKNPINNTVFATYNIHNKSAFNYSDFFMTLYENPDLGCFSNDRIGCDSDKSMMFVYNGTTPDPLYCQNEYGYDSLPVSHGTIFLNQRATYFSYSPNLFIGIGDPSPVQCSGYRNLNTGLWADGTPFTQGATGYGGTSPVNYVFPSDPMDATGWSEITVAAQLPPGDRKMFGGVGPMTFASGETKRFDFAFTISYDSTATRLSIVDTLKRDADLVRAFYNSNLAQCLNQLHAHITSIDNKTIAGAMPLKVFPNPANTTLYINAETDINRIQLTDLQGRSVIEKQPNSSQVSIDVSHLAKGVYLVKVTNGNGNFAVRKIVVQ